MFTDKPTIPARLETLLEVLYVMRARKADRSALRALVQPSGLPDLSDQSRQVDDHLSAAQELGLIASDEDGNYRLTYRVKAEHEAKRSVLEAFDKVALGGTSAEPWASRFYGFLIAQESDVVPAGEGPIREITRAFMESLPAQVDRRNPMNLEKFRALTRWYQYAGLGWFDPEGSFVPDPMRRIQRVLDSVFIGEPTLDSSSFMARLASLCPELDGGALFSEVTAAVYSVAERRCTRALATALRNLHDLGYLRLFCPRDSKGWSLERGGSVLVPGVLDSDRFDRVTLVRARDSK